MPFTFNAIPKRIQDYTFGNKFATLTIYLPLEEDFEKACLESSKIMNKMKNSLIPLGQYAVVQCYAWFLPHFWTNHVYRSAGAKHTLMLSNLPGF